MKNQNSIFSRGAELMNMSLYGQLPLLADIVDLVGHEAASME
jgi:hypothetical protein